MLTPTQYKLL